MVQICEIKRSLEAIREVKEFDDNAYFDLVRDPRFKAPDKVLAVHVEFMQGDVHVVLEAPVLKRLEEA